MPGVSIAKQLVRVPLGWAISVERLLGGLRLLADPGAVTSVLILEYTLPLGCLVHMTPVFAAIKSDRPQLIVTVATRGLGAELLRHNPCVDHVIETPDALTDTLGTVRFLKAELKRRGIKPECVLTGSSDRRTRIAAVGVLLGLGWRGGFTLLPELYQWELEYLPGKSLIDNNLRLAALTGCRIAHREPKVYFSRADVATAEGLVREANPHSKPLVVLVTQNSGGQKTGWHAERFAQVIRHAGETLGCAVVFVGTEKDGAAIELLRAQAGGIGTSMAGRTSVTELAALLALSDLVVSLDTGTMHVGRAMETPMVVIGPSWQKPLEWLPLESPQVRILRGEDRTDIPENYQLDEVKAQQVIEAMDELLQIYPAAAASRAARVAAGLSDVDHRA